MDWTWWIWCRGKRVQFGAGLAQSFLYWQREARIIQQPLAGSLGAVVVLKRLDPVVLWRAV